MQLSMLGREVLFLAAPLAGEKLRKRSRSLSDAVLDGTP
jgi:hypothetical protein